MSGFVEVLPWDASRSEWLAERRKGVGSSDIAVLLGLSSWDSPFGLYHRKTGALGEQDEQERMYWGRKLEAVIADEFAERHPEFALTRVGLCRSVDRPYQQATPDRLLYDTAVDPDRALIARAFPEHAVTLRLECVGALEVKTDESFDGWGPDGSDEIPLKYRAQVLWQADCLGLPGVHVAALLPGKRYREYYVERDDTDLKLMRDVAEQFMARVHRNDPPDVDALPATLDTLRRLHPNVDDETATVPHHLAMKYRAACRSYAKAKDRKKLIENRLRERMGRARVACDPDGDKLVTRVVFDKKPHEVGPAHVDYLTPAKEPA